MPRRRGKPRLLRPSVALLVLMGVVATAILEAPTVRASQGAGSVFLSGACTGTLSAYGENSAVTWLLRGGPPYCIRSLLGRRQPAAN